VACASGVAPGHGVNDSGPGNEVTDARHGSDARRVDARPAALDAMKATDARPAVDARMVDAKPMPDAKPMMPDAKPIPDAKPMMPDAKSIPDAKLMADAMSVVDADPCAGGGCKPTGIALTGLTFTAQRGNTGGGGAYDDACPAGQVLIGAAGYLSSSTGFHERIQAVCGVLFLAGTDPYVAAISAGNTLALRGLNGSSYWSRTCSQNEAVVGFDGRSGALIDQLTLRCAPLIVGKAGNTYTLSVGAASSLAAAGGSGGSAFPRTDCPSGQVATMARIRAGDSIDAFGLGCSTPSLTF
jgi:hypothetical protein